MRFVIELRQFMVHVELIYAPKLGSCVHLKLELSDGATVSQAINQSNIQVLHPETKELAIGIYGKLVSQDTLLKEGDRIELYRPLIIDPKEKRRKLARARVKNKS